MAFTGFDKRAMGFFHELAVEMNRDWYNDNKARYQALWVEPMTALLADVRGKLAKTYRGIQLAEPKLFRLHRDVRFAKDKTPYKTHCAGLLAVNARKPVDGGCTALYIHLGLPDEDGDDEYLGAGTYYFDAAQLVRWRKLVAAPKTGAAIEALVEELREAGYTVGGHDDYVRVPRGFAPDHPRAALLRMKGLTAGFPAIPRGKIHRADFVDWIVEHATAVAPLVRWLHANVK